MRIINFGSLNIDYVYRVDAFVRPAETKACKSLSVNCGGKGLNQSVAAARAGNTVLHAGFLGRDGGMLRAKLVEKGVDVSLLRESEGLSGNAIIEVDDAGQNRIILFGGTNRTLTETMIDETLAKAEPGDWVLMQNETNLVDYILTRAHEKGLKTALNAAPMEEKVKDWPLGKLDLLFVNEVEGAALAGVETIPEILPALRKAYPSLAVVLTLGKEGAVFSTAEERWRVGSCSVPVKDTTAAGDTFTGFFLYGYTHGLGAEETLRLATAASAMCVQKPGAADSVPSLEDVKTAMGTGELKVPAAVREA